MAPFAHLHVHSCFSFHDGVDSPAALVARAAQLGYGTLALTDANGLYGAVPFCRAAKEAGIAPLLGAEIDAGDPDGPRAVVLARGRAGYPALCRIVTRRQLERGGDGCRGGVHPLPTGTAARAGRRGGAEGGPPGGADRREHRRESAATGPRSPHGHVSSLADLIAPEAGRVVVLAADPALLRALAPRLPAGTLLGELVYDGTAPAASRCRATLAACRALGLPFAATNAVRFAAPEGHETHRLLRAIGESGTIWSVPPRAHPQHFLKSAGEMHALFAHLPGALEASGRIAAECACAIGFEGWKFPEAHVPPGETPFSVLWQKAFAGLAARYRPLSREAVERLRYEIGIIDAKGFAPYFLAVDEIAGEARARGMRTIGRGSAANSLVSHCLGLTHVDPLAHGLFFERFLNPERSSPPDIDLDFSWKDRDALVAWVYERWGADRVAMISTHVTFGPRGALRETGKAHGLPDAELTRLTRRIPHWGVDDLTDLPAAIPECRSLPADDPTFARMASLGQRIVGLPRHLSVHAGGIVIAPAPLTDFLPLARAAKGLVVTQPDMGPVEELGLIKIDLLAQRSLGVLQDAVAAVAAHAGEAPPVDERERVLADPATRALIREGRTMGCFYVESPAMRSLLRKLATDTFEDLTAASSVIRPGVAESGMMQEYIRRHHLARDGRAEINPAPTTDGVRRTGINPAPTTDGDGRAGINPAPTTDGVRRAGINPAPTTVGDRRAGIDPAPTTDGDRRAGINPAPTTVGDRRAGINPAPTTVGDRRAGINPAPTTDGDRRAGINPAPTTDGVRRAGINPAPTTDGVRRAGINPAPTTCSVGEGFIPSLLPVPERRVGPGGAQPRASTGGGPQQQDPGASLGPDAWYSDPRLEPVLRETHGVMIYQEDVLRVAHVLAGMSLGEADLLRRSMSGKLRSAEAMAKVRDGFLAGCAANGVAPATAAEVWRQVESFAGYAFCKAHSASYALLSFQVAYLKAHHPAEFMAAVISNQGGYYGTAAYASEARRMGLAILLPDVNRSGRDWSGRGREIRMGLMAFAGLEAAAVDGLLAARRDGGPFTNLSDLLARSGLGRAELEMLVRGGACDGFELTRPELLWRLACRFPGGGHPHPGPLPSRERETGELFPGAGGLDHLVPRLPEYPLAERCRMEEEIFGFPVTRHPLELAADDADDADDGDDADGRAGINPAPTMVGGRRAGINPAPTTVGDGRAGINPAPTTVGDRRAGINPAPTTVGDRRAGINPAPTTVGDRRAGIDSAPTTVGDRRAGIDPAPSTCSVGEGFIPSRQPGRARRGGTEAPPLVTAADMHRHAGRRVRMRGLVISYKRVPVRRTGAWMKFLSCEDLTGTFEAVLFPAAYARCAEAALGAGPWLLEGRVEVDHGVPSLDCDGLRPLARQRAAAPDPAAAARAR